VTPSLPYQWYETPNLHFLTICSDRIVPFLKIRARTNFLTLIDRQIKIRWKQNLVLQVTSQGMASHVGKACSAPLQPPHIEALQLKHNER